MKKLIYIFLALLMFSGCKDDTESFTVTLSPKDFQTTPVMGGALLQYTLPDDPQVMAINVRYHDVYGNPILRSGSNSTNQMKLFGFNEAQNDIKAQVTFVRRDNTESQPIEINFSTLDSAPVMFLDSAAVESGWSGCTLEYTNPEGATGMAHVFYLGTSPVDHQPDTILLESFPLIEGHEIRHYNPKQRNAYNTIVVRVEDYRGYIVKERVWEKIQAFNTKKLEAKDFSIIYNNSLEVPAEKIGLQYLTDGDTKGTSWFEDQNNFMYHTFISRANGAGAASEPMYIDLKKNRATSEIRFYAQRYIGAGKPNLTNTAYEGPKYIVNSWANKLPCSVTVYGCRENTNSQNWDSMKWEELGTFEDDPDNDMRSRWTYTAATCGGTTFGRNTFGTLVKMEKAAPIYKAINIDISKQQEGFRYLKIKFNGVYHLANESPSMTNTTTNYLSFHELEIYSDAE